MTDAIVQNNLKRAGLRPTRQRLMIGTKLWSGYWKGQTRHFTAERLHKECAADGMQVSMATIYNTLHQFVEVGLLQEVVVDSGRSYFDTNISHHHHFLNEETRELIDIPEEHITISRMPDPAIEHKVSSVDVVIRVKPI